MDIKYRSDMTVELIDHMGDDQRVCQAARVSTQGAASLDAEESKGLIEFLANNRHGSPFEHCAYTFFIQAPIFVWREIMRHRIASYNEESGRYKTLEPVFYIPDANRALVQMGKPGHYNYVGGSSEQYELMKQGHEGVARESYAVYLELLDAGIAREVARMSLPLNIYSSAYVTMNARALTNFLSLRTKDEWNATFPSYPQREIEMVAESMELKFAETMPIVWNAWHFNGRVPL